MDEPTVALTRNEIELLFKVILSLKEKGISTLFLSHKLIGSIPDFSKSNHYP